MNTTIRKYTTWNDNNLPINLVFSRIKNGSLTDTITVEKTETKAEYITQKYNTVKNLTFHIHAYDTLANVLSIVKTESEIPFEICLFNAVLLKCKTEEDAKRRFNSLKRLLTI